MGRSTLSELRYWFLFSVVLIFAAGVASSQERETRSRPYLGMRAVSASDPAARRLGVQAREGAVVLATDVAGPIDNAGLQYGDRIVEFAGKPISTVDDLIQTLAATGVGNSKTIVFFRGQERRTSQLVVGGREPEGVSISSPAVPPNASPIDGGPPKTPVPVERQAPPGWVEKQVGSLMVYIPPDWTPTPFLASDEGCWFLGPSENKTAIFAIIRDLPKDELLAPMTVEREGPEMLAGREAVGYFGATVEQNIDGKGLVVFPTRREADRTLLAVLCFAADEKWPQHEATFRTMLSLVRNRAASP